MWNHKNHVAKKSGGNGLVAVAVDKDKGSQFALKWAVENLLSRGQTVILIHVVTKHNAHSGYSQVSDNLSHKSRIDKLTKELFLTFRCYCTCKDIHCHDVVIEDTDITKAITEYISHTAIENLVLGAPTKHAFIRRFKADVASCVSKVAPDFCTVYVISKGKVSSMRNAARSAPFTSPLVEQLQQLNQPQPLPQQQQQTTSSVLEANPRNSISFRERSERTPLKPSTPFEEAVRMPNTRRAGGYIAKPPFGDYSELDSDISFVSSGRPSIEQNGNMFLDLTDSAPRMSNCSAPRMSNCSAPRMSNGSENSIGSYRLGIKFTDRNALHDFSDISEDSGRTSCSYSSQNIMNDDVEAEMRRLKLELKQTMDMYSTACKEALTAKQKASELQRWRLEEEGRLEEARFAEEAALSLAEKERAKCKAAVEAAEAAKKAARLEANRKNKAETKEHRGNNFHNPDHSLRYRRYTIDEIEKATDNFAESRRIGEGGYGPVYKCYLDHTPVAVKVLRPDAQQGRSQFQQEIGVLSCIRHPNMVLLLGACPEYGIIVYEYMAKGSLDDCLFNRGKSPPLPWQIRFRIASEIATGLLFLHQAKPEPIVHRDLKPGNILLDFNYVSKISDVGLARLVPAIAENVTQYRMTSTAGTFCYIDPEYQQTGMLGVKSDVYSLGIMLLQIITAKPPMGLTHYVESAIENGKLHEMLDPAVTDWPMEETTSFAKLSLQCAELRRKDRPDLGNDVLPELNRLREFAEESMGYFFFGGGYSCPGRSSESHSQVVMSDPHLGFSHSQASAP